MSGKVLVIGAGRIAAEALKNVVASGFMDIEIVDMEVDDVEELSEQFTEKVYSAGKPRAEIIRDSIMKDHPNIQIKVTNYGYSFFQQFNLVLNALDNPLVRDQVNVMCTKSNVSFIDCYKCASPKEPITADNADNTPLDMMHCVWWSKWLLRQLFGAEVMHKIRQIQNGTKLLASITALKELKHEAILYDENIKRNVKISDFNAQLMFEELFGDYNKDSLLDPLKTSLVGIGREYKIWSRHECQSIFETSLIELRNGLVEQGNMDAIRLELEIMDFLCASANLQALKLDVPCKSRLEIQLMLTVVLNEPGLFDMPTEVLDCIFGYLDDETLLAVLRTCKRFQPVANRAFEQKYSNQMYKITNMEDIHYQQMHRSILLNFGAKLPNIEITDTDLTDESQWLLDVLKENNTTLKQLKLTNLYEDADINFGDVLRFFPNITHLDLNGYMIDEEDNWSNIHMPYLIHFGLYNMDYVDQELFDRFFDNNRQIESLTFQDTANDHMESINSRMIGLKSLQIPDYDFDLSPVNLESLEKLEITECTDDVLTLDAFTNGCKNITDLIVKFDEDQKLNENYIKHLASFEKLHTLDITDDEITIDQIKLVERHLRNLKSFAVTTEINSEHENQLIIDEILSLVSNTKLLTRLHLTISLKSSKVEFLNMFNADLFTRLVEGIGIDRPGFKLFLDIEGRHGQVTQLVLMKKGIVRIESDDIPVLVHQLPNGWN